MLKNKINDNRNDSSSNKGDVMDAFLTHAYSEIENKVSDLIKLGKNYNKVQKKKKQIILNQILEKMKSFPPNDSSYLMLLQTFSSLASNSIPNILTILSNFFPSLLYEAQSNNNSQKSILNSLPQNKSDDITDLINGYINEVVFCSFLQSFLEKITNIKESDVNFIMDRLFKLTTLPQLSPLKLDILILALNNYYGVIRIITQHKLGYFKKSFEEYFPTKKSSPQLVMTFVTAISGMTFGEHNFSIISDTFLQFSGIMKHFESNGEVFNLICLSLCHIIPHMKNLQQEKFLEKIEHRANKMLKDHNAWSSALKLNGVIHNLIPQQISPKYSKFLENSVFKRFKKPHKINAALDYIISVLLPSDDCVYNWSPQTNEFIKLVFENLFLSNINLTGVEIKASLILEHIAALDLPVFTAERLPLLLTPTSQYATVALIAIQRILNPMSKFQELSKAVPTNAVTGVHKQLSIIIQKTKEFIIQRFLKYEFKQTDFFMTIDSLNDVILAMDVPPELEELNTQEILSHKALYYLLRWRKIPPTIKLNNEDAMNIKKANKICYKLMCQWDKTFDTPHNSLGILLEKDVTEQIKSAPFKDSIDLNLLPLIPIIMSQIEKGIEELIHPIFCLMCFDDPYIATLSSMMYQLIYISFPKHTIFFLEQLRDHIERIMKISVFQFHHLIQTYHFCLLATRNKYTILPSSIISDVDFLAFTALCSPFPETHIIGLHLIEINKMIRHMIPNSEDITILSDVIDNCSQKIEQKMIVTIISEYSAWSDSSCPVHRMPTIKFNIAAVSNYNLLWRFVLDQLTQEIITYPAINVVISLRNKYFIYLKNIFEKKDITNLKKCDMCLLTNITIFVFSSSMVNPECSPKNELKIWHLQLKIIEELISDAIKVSLILEKNMLTIFSFVFTALNISTLSRTIKSFIDTLSSKDVKLYQKENALLVFTIMLRHVAMHPFFDDYVAKMIQTGQIKSILRIFDTSLQIFTVVKGVEHYRQLFHVLDQFSHYLVFRGQYYRFLHQSRIQTPHCPLPRCALTINVKEEDISPICSLKSLFELLFEWSLIDNEEFKNTDLEAALLVEHETPTIQHLNGFCHAARVALTFMVPLKQIFKHESDLPPQFLEKVTLVARKRPAFIKHLLTKHLHTLLVPFANMALSNELESATVFFTAICAQFVPPISQNSMIYSHNTFINNMSTSNPSKISDYDKRFINLVYTNTGTLLFSAIFFMLHDNIAVRQNAMRMIGQVFPILCLMHFGGDITATKNFTLITSKLINGISTVNDTLRIQYAVDLSTCASNSFQFATEQVLNRAFTALPSEHLNRKSCSRDHLLKILLPWFNGFYFNLNKGTILCSPSYYFTYYSPYSFINEFVKIMDYVKPYTLLLPFWQNIISGSMNQDSNTKIITIVLLDIAITNKKARKNLIYILLFIYRVQPNNTLSILVNSLHYSNWYYYHVQLMRYEDILDMDEFLNDLNNKKYNHKNNSMKQHDQYSEIIDFALEALNELAAEDIIPFISFFNIIITFSLTHIHMKNALNLLCTITESLNNSFATGSPACIFAANQFLKRVKSIQFEALKFVPYSSESSMKALQSRIVSTGELLSMFINMYKFIPSNSDEELSEQLLLWGLSCGDLKIAANALYLYSIEYETIDESIINHIIESCCIVIRSIYTSNVELKTMNNTAEYINAVFRVLVSITKNLARENLLSNYHHIFFFIISLIGLGGTLLPLIIDDILKLIICFINFSVFEPKSKNNFNIDTMIEFIPKWSDNFKDMKPFVKRALLTCKSTEILLQFIMQIIKLPVFLIAHDNNFSFYIAIIAPYICCAIEDPQKFSKLCKLNSFLESVSILSKHGHNSYISTLLDDFLDGKYKVSKNFSDKLMKVLKELATADIFIDSADIYSRMLFNTPMISINCIFDLCAGIISVFPSKEIISALLPLAKEAIINRELGDLSRKTAFLEEISSYKETYSTSQFPRYMISDKFDEPWINSFVFIQNYVSEQLHMPFKDTTDIIRIRFDKPENYPPICPFENGFTRNECIDEIVSICRNIQVNPQTNYSFSIYCSHEISEERAGPNESPELNLSLDYDSIMERIIGGIYGDNENSDEDTEYDEKDSQINNKEEKNTSKSIKLVSNDDGLFLITKNAFLPTDDICNSIVELVLQNNKL